MKALVALIFLTAIPQSVLAMNYGQALVDKAYGAAGSPYKSSYPPNKWLCPGGYFDFSTWTKSNGFDCSGLVSYAADLRRRYETRDLTGARFSTAIGWDLLQPGDLLYTNGVLSSAFPYAHVMVFVSRDGDNLAVVHAGSFGVVEKTWNISLIRDTWKFTPYRLIHDITPANTTVTGVENGKTYKNNIGAKFAVTDAIDPQPCGEFYVNDFLTQHGKSGGKVFSEDGSYKLRIHTVDWAKNTKDILLGFTIGGLNAHKINSETALYDNFKGISDVNPSTLERTHTIYFNNTSVGISSVGIVGPQGVIWNQTFDPPVSSTSAVLTDLPVGDYTVKSFSAAGSETRTPFKISDLNVSVSLLESTQNYFGGDLFNSGTFYIKAHIVAESPVELSRIQVLTSTGGVLSTWALLAERTVSGHSASGDFDLPAFPLSCPPGLPWSQDHPCTLEPRSYLARVIDSEGNIKAVTFSLALTSKNGLSTDTPPALLGNGSYDYSYGTDTTKSDYIPSPIVLNYDIIESTSGRYLNTGTGYAIEPSLVSGYVPQHSASAPDIARPQTIGTLQQIIRTWDNADKSDISETLVSEVEVFFDTFETHEYQSNIYCNDLMGLFLCGRQTINTPVLQSAKRYAEWKTVYNKTSDATVPVCRRISYADYLDFECARYGARIVPFGGGAKLIGFTLSQAPTPPVHLALIPIGKNIFAPLNSYGEAYFDEVTAPGYLSITATTNRPPAGFSEAPQNTTYEITPSSELAFTGNVTLILKYPAANLTSAQENLAKLVKVQDPATGKYTDLIATLNPGNNTITVPVTSFSNSSKFMVIAPEYAEPHTIQSASSVNGSPELEFMSGVISSLSQYDMGASAGEGTLAGLKSANLLPVGNVYNLSTASDTFEPSGAIKMRYSAGTVAGLGVDENSLAIYGFTESGDSYMLPDMTLNKDDKVLTGRVPSAAYPLFAVLASSQQVENIPPSVYPDGIPPETTMSFGGTTAPAPDGTYVSSTTTIVLSASDPQVPNLVTSGVNLTDYILHPDADPVEYTYAGPFTLPEGVHPMHYYSVDNAGNYGPYVNSFPPVIFSRRASHDAGRAFHPTLHIISELYT